MGTVDEAHIAAAAAEAAPELRALAAHTLEQFRLDPDDPKVAMVAAAGAVFVSSVAQWSKRSGLPDSSALVVEAVAAVAAEAFFGLAQGS